jgi:hypothetical protein
LAAGKKRAGAGALSEAADDAALDHDRALRALFAGDDARGGDAAVGPGLLLDFRLHDIERHSHQRCGDLGLLLLIVGDADGGEDRLVQGGRVVADAPRAIFGIPVCAHGGLISIRDT